MSILSIFVDESGDFGKVGNSSPYYIVTLVMHDQSESINETVHQLENSMSYLALDFSYIHTDPIIRRETPYLNMTIDERRQLLYKMRGFMLHAPIKHASLVINRRETRDKFSHNYFIEKAQRVY